MKIINSVITFMAIFTLVGCNDNKEKNENLTPINKESPLVIHKDETPKEDKKILNKIGITTEGEKIIIDTNKTKTFFENMAKTLTKEAKKVEEKTKNLDSTDFGININKDKIEIDTKKTKNFLEQFSKELEDIANDIDKEINK